LYVSRFQSTPSRATCKYRGTTGSAAPG
jgi:hypothetical protein